MSRYRISKSELTENNNSPLGTNFPKYTSQLINWANQNAQGTRPRVVGQMSDLFPEYRASETDHSVATWKAWYMQRYPAAIENATAKIEAQIENLKKAIQLIDHHMVKEWVTDLVINKTYTGLYYQQMILSYLAAQKGCSWRLATPEEESKGIDGYVGDIAYSIKPTSYKTMNRLSEEIHVTMIYYTIAKSGDLSFSIED